MKEQKSFLRKSLEFRKNLSGVALHPMQTNLVKRLRRCSKQYLRAFWYLMKLDLKLALRESIFPLIESGLVLSPEVRFSSLVRLKYISKGVGNGK